MNLNEQIVLLIYVELFI